MKSLKLNFTVPEDVAAALRERVRKRQRSAFVASAVRDKLHELEQEQLKRSLMEGYQARWEEFEILVPRGVAGLTVDSRIKAKQIRTVDKGRLTSFRGSLPPQYLPRVEKALKTHLSLT